MNTSVTQYPAKPVAPADGAAIASLIAAFFIPFVAIVLGHVSRGTAKRAGYKPSAAATWGCVLGWVFTGIALLVVLGFVVTLIVAAGSAGTSGY